VPSLLLNRPSLRQREERFEQAAGPGHASSPNRDRRGFRRPLAWDCSIQERRLLPGDTLALYTDGITESFDDAGEEFGEERLVELLVKGRELPSRALLDSIVDEVRRFSPHEQHDDITLIVAKCRGT